MATRKDFTNLMAAVIAENVVNLEDVGFGSFTSSSLTYKVRFFFINFLF